MESNYAIFKPRSLGTIFVFRSILELVFDYKHFVGLLYPDVYLFALYRVDFRSESSS